METKIIRILYFISRILYLILSNPLYRIALEKLVVSNFDLYVFFCRT
jgi:hypothetical protein